MRRFEKPLSGVKALVMGLGLHGGGVATTKWLIAQGARVTVTDKRDANALASSIRALESLPVRFVLGRHDEKDFVSHDMVIVNPGVPKESPFLALAKASKKRLENDTSLFFRMNQEPKIAVTGTRGKTTTTLYIASLLRSVYPDARTSGNTPENALLKEFSRRRKKGTPIVSELSLW
jgi:UDP-N-acetylmuramoylalanine--D-glutamate ligase